MDPTQHPPTHVKGNIYMQESTIRGTKSTQSHAEDDKDPFAGIGIEEAITESPDGITSRNESEIVETLEQYRGIPLVTSVDCVKCRKTKDVRSLGSLGGAEPMLGDIKLKFVCASCSRTEKDEYEWPQRRHWVEIGYLAFVNLAAQNEGFPIPIQGQYYHLQTQVFKFIYSHFPTLCAGHARNCWKSNLAISLGYLSSHFEHSDGQQGKGWWRVRHGATYPTEEEASAAARAALQAHHASDKRSDVSPWSRTPSTRKPVTDSEQSPTDRKKKPTQSHTHPRPTKTQGSTPSRIRVDKPSTTSSIHNRPPFAQESLSEEEDPRPRARRPKPMLHKVNSVPSFATDLSIDSHFFKKAIAEALQEELDTNSSIFDKQPPAAARQLQEELQSLESAGSNVRNFVSRMIRSRRTTKISASLIREYRNQYETGVVLSDMETLAFPFRSQGSSSSSPHLLTTSTQAPINNRPAFPSMLPTHPHTYLPRQSAPSAQDSAMPPLSSMPATLSDFPPFQSPTPFRVPSFLQGPSERRNLAPWPAFPPIGFLNPSQHLWPVPASMSLATTTNTPAQAPYGGVPIFSPVPMYPDRLVGAKRPRGSLGSESPSLAPSKRSCSLDASQAPPQQNDMP